jgi:hypothetical protein
LKQTAHRNHPVTVWVARALLPFLVVAGLMLTLFPTQTELLFAWAIQPSMTALLMGAGYLSGVWYFGAIARAKNRPVGVEGLPAIATFAALSALETFLHWPNFNHQHPSFWAWVSLYLLTPFLVPALWWLERKHSPTSAQADPILAHPSRGVILTLGALTALSGIILFVIPTTVAPFWPWTISALTGRVLGSWFVLAGLAMIAQARSSDLSATRLLIESQWIGLSLILIAIVRTWSDFDRTHPAALVFLASMGALWILVTRLALNLRRRSI